MSVTRPSTTLFWITFIGVLAISQLSGYLVQANLEIGESVKLMSFFHFTHVRNTGGIFGIMQGKGWLFAAVSLLFIAGIVIFVMRSYSVKRFELFCLGLITGGGGSNILDRLIYGSVIDFIDIRGISFWKYVFNTADVMIHLGVWPLLIIGIFFTKDEDEPEVAAS